MQLAKFRLREIQITQFFQKYKLQKGRKGWTEPEPTD